MDGEVFLLLTDEDMGEMVKPLGARRKLITKRNMLTCVSTFVAYYIFSLKDSFFAYIYSQSNLQLHVM